MAWAESTGVDLSHYNYVADYAAARAAVDWVQLKLTEGVGWVDSVAPRHHAGFAGVARGAYHFARTSSSVRDQVAHFLARRAVVGGAAWERPDMLDVEAVAGDPAPTGAFVAELVAEYRRQSGRHVVLVYTPLDPSGWWTPGCYVWRARYRNVLQPPRPDDWATYLGIPDHPALAVLQWSSTWQLPGGGFVDANVQRLDLEDDVTPDEMLDAPVVRSPGSPLPGSTSLRGVLAYTDETWGNNRASLARLETLAGQLAAAVAGVRAAVDEPIDLAALAAGLAPLLVREDVTLLADAVADELDRRARDGDPATGPAT